jgi:putative transposase
MTARGKLIQLELEFSRTVKESRFREEQIIGIVKQHEAGVKTADLCREHGISPAAIYGWKSKYGGMEVNEAQHLRQMEDENRRPKQLVADLSLEREVPPPSGSSCASALHLLRLLLHRLFRDHAETGFMKHALRINSPAQDDKYSVNKYKQTR